LAGRCGWGLGGVGEVFVARVLSGGKVTIPLLVREVLKIREGDYVRVSISEVIKQKQQQQQRKAETGRRRWDPGQVCFGLFSLFLRCGVLWRWCPVSTYPREFRA